MVEVKLNNVLILPVLFSLIIQATALDCGDDDYIIELLSSNRSVQEYKFLSVGELPGGWKMEAKGTVPWDNYEKILAQSYPERINFYGTKGDGEYLKDVYYQTFREPDTNELVTVIVEEFKARQYATRLFNKYLEKHSFSYDITLGDNSFVGKQVDGKRILFFIKYERIVQITASKISTLQEIGVKFEYPKTSLGVDQTVTWKARICKDHADVCTQKIYYNTQYESVELISCETNHSGEIKKCPKDRIEEYSGLLKIVFPECAKDDTIEYQIQETETTAFPNHVFPTSKIFLNDTVGTEQLFISLEYPATLDIKTYGKIKPEATAGEGKRTLTWDIKNLKPYETEPYMPDRKEVLDILYYSTISSWDTVQKWFEERFTPATKENVEVNKLSGEIFDESDSEDVKIQKIHGWVQENIRYEDAELGYLTGYEPHKLDDIIRDKVGDCKDYTALTLALLKTAGMKANPVLVSSDEIDENIPDPYSFNHAIVQVIKNDGGRIWLDTTCTACPINYLPPEYQDKNALVLFGEGLTKTPIMEADNPSAYTTHRIVRVDESGNGNITLKLAYKGGTGVILSQLLKNANEEAVKEGFRPEVSNECLGAKVDSYTIVEKPAEYQITLNISCSRVATKTSDQLVYNFPEDQYFTGILEKYERIFPIDLTRNKLYTSTTEIMLPEGFEVSDYAPSASEEKYYSKFKLNQGFSENKFTSEYNLTLNKKQITAEEFDDFKKYFTSVNEKIQQSIIISKKKKEENERGGQTEEKQTEKQKPGESQLSQEEPLPVTEKKRVNPIHAVIGVLVLAVVIVLAARKK